MHYPQNSVARRVGVIVSVSALKYRIGPYRLNVKIARHLCNDGYYVLRFDPEAIGDSEGKIEHDLNINHFISIQKGRYTLDTMAAIDFFTSHIDIQNLVLIGVCGGAITALHTGRVDPRPDSLVLLNVPVAMQQYLEGYADTITTPKYARQVLSLYISRLLGFGAWIRFLSFKSDYAAIWKAIKLYVSDRLTQALTLSRKDTRSHKMNPHFLKSFRSYVNTKRKILFIQGELDPAHWEFQREFQDVYLRNNCNRSECEIKIIREGNHIFSGTQSQIELLNTISDWLNRRYNESRCNNT